MSSYSLKTTAILALTSSLLSSVRGGALPPSTPTSPTCTNNASEGTTFGGFKISCGVDYYGGDLSNSWLPSFEACINDCGNTEGCIDVSFAGDDNGGQCYRKSSVGKLSQNGGVWTALKLGSGPAPAPPGLSCAGGADDGKTYTSANGKHFKVICGKEYYGGDLLYANVPTFEKCLDTCSTTEGCIDVSYVGENCYMKSTIGELINAEPVWTGEFFVPPPPPVVSTTTSAVSSPTPTPAGPLTCENGASNGIEFTTPAQNVYEIACGTDYAGGDLTAVDAETFEACLTACDVTAGCIDVAYVAPRCYLKSSLEPPVALAHVWGAKFLRSVATTSSSTTSAVSSSTTEVSSSSTTSEASSTTSEASSTTSAVSSSTTEASTSSTTSEASSSTTSEASSSSTTSEASSSTTTTSEQISSTTTTVSPTQSPTTTISSTQSPTTTSRAALTTMKVCNRDLCLRAMVNTKVSASASAFCSTYTTAVVTEAAAIPTYLAEGCKNLASRVSSACSCVVTPAPTVY